MQNTDENSRYCRDMVAVSDRERYLWSLFLPAKAQRAVWAIWAFNQEVAKIWDTVSEPALADIRLQWWREVLDEIQAGSVRQQPVIVELSALNNKERIFPKLRKAIEARQKGPFSEAADITGLRQYVEGAGGALHQAAALAIDEKISETALQAVQYIGEAWAMAGLIRALPYYWQHNRDMGSGAFGEITRLPEPALALKKLTPLIADMHIYAQEKLVSAAGLSNKLTRQERLCYLPAVLVGLHLEALGKADNNPFELPKYEISDFTRMRKLLWGAIIRKP